MAAKAARFLLITAFWLVVSHAFEFVTRLNAPVQSPPLFKRFVDPPLKKGGNDPRLAGFTADAPFSFDLRHIFLVELTFLFFFRTIYIRNAARKGGFVVQHEGQKMDGLLVKKIDPKTARNLDETIPKNLLGTSSTESATDKVVEIRRVNSGILGWVSSATPSLGWF